MIDKIKEIIADFQDAPLETGVERQLAVSPLPKKATVCIGVRRCGKSTYMAQLMQKLLDSGIPKQNLLYLNFFDDRLHKLQHGGLDAILEAYFSLYPEKKHTEKVYCFFDEIQVASGWEPFIDRLMRTEKCDVYITGSSAQLLSREIGTQMRGRALSWEMFPFSFVEYLKCKGIKDTSPRSTKDRLLIQKAFEDYWETGGFPEVVGLSRPMRLKIHQEYFNTMLFRDLIERHDISHPRAVLDLAHWLIDNTGCLYSINSLTGYLKSLGHKAPKSAVSDYLLWFEDAYVFYSVRLFDASLSRSNANPKKIYFVDHAMVTSIHSGILVNSGHLLENLVFMALRRVTPNIFYFRTKSGAEVDFLAQSKGQTRLLIQVCESLSDPQTRKRETTALAQAMAELNLSEGCIVTRHQDDIIPSPSGDITVVPAWKFLLSLSGSSMAPAEL